MSRKKLREDRGDASYPSRATMSEKQLAESYLGDFDPKGSKGELFISAISPSPMTRNGLITLAKTFSKLSKIPFKRDFNRRAALIVKWFDDHYEELMKFKDFIVLEFEDNEK